MEQGKFYPETYFIFYYLFNRALLEFININSRIRIAKSETHFYDNKFEKVRGDQVGSVV